MLTPGLLPRAVVLLGDPLSRWPLVPALSCVLLFPFSTSIPHSHLSKVRLGRRRLPRVAAGASLAWFHFRYVNSEQTKGFQTLLTLLRWAKGLRKGEKGQRQDACKHLGVRRGGHLPCWDPDCRARHFWACSTCRDACCVGTVSRR